MAKKTVFFISNDSVNMNSNAKTADGITLKPGQQQAFDKLKDFIRDTSCRVFILRGYAGTGKTTLMKVLTEELKKQNRPFSLLASTGRAAKILTNITGRGAATVHSEIYTYQDLNQNLEEVMQQRNRDGMDSSGQLTLNFTLNTKETDPRKESRYYIVDEASMIADKEDKTATQAMFGSGRLLKDLFEHDARGKFVFIGDNCQLPPITQSVSPALSAAYIRQTFNMKVMEAELTEIVRQDARNGIVLSSQKMRALYRNPPSIKWAKFPFRNHSNIVLFNSQAQLLEHYIQQVREKGFNHSTLICHANRMCDMVTRIIRPALGIHSPLLSVGDLILVTQNNYISGLMNGDLAMIEYVGITERRAGLTFQKVAVKELFSKQTYSQLIITDVLYGNQTNLSQTQQKELFLDFYLRMKAVGIEQKSLLFSEEMMRDPYLNALRAVYGYALTCHKAQGGEWEHVYLDIARSVPVMEKPFVYQWVYTAMTRAKTKLYLVDDFWVG